MTEIYIVRHCEAKGNQKRIFQGGVNCDITPLGQTQLDYLKERFKDIKLDAVYTSPLIRAQKTAFAVIGEKDLNAKIDYDLREIEGGVVDGKPFYDALHADKVLADAWDNHPQDFEPEGGERMRDAYERIYNCILKIAKENDGKTVAVATHGGVIRCLMARLELGTIERLAEMPWAENTAVALLTYENGKFTVRYRYDHTHVPEEFLPVRNRLSTFMKKVGD